MIKIFLSFFVVERKKIKWWQEDIFGEKESRKRGMEQEKN